MLLIPDASSEINASFCYKAYETQSFSQFQNT